MKALLILLILPSAFAYDSSRLKEELDAAFEAEQTIKINTNSQNRKFKRTRLIHEIKKEDKIYNLEETFDQLGKTALKDKKFKRSRKQQ